MHVVLKEVWTLTMVLVKNDCKQVLMKQKLYLAVTSSSELRMIYFAIHFCLRNGLLYCHIDLEAGTCSFDCLLCGIAFAHRHRNGLASFGGRLLSTL